MLPVEVLGSIPSTSINEVCRESNPGPPSPCITDRSRYCYTTHPLKTIVPAPTSPSPPHSAPPSLPPPLCTYRTVASRAVPYRAVSNFAHEPVQLCSRACLTLFTSLSNFVTSLSNFAQEPVQLCSRACPTLVTSVSNFAHEPVQLCSRACPTLLTALPTL